MDTRSGRSRDGFQDRERTYAPRTRRSDESGEFRQPRKKSAYFGKPYGPPQKRKPRFDGDQQNEKSFVQSRLKRQRKYVGTKRGHIGKLMATAKRRAKEKGLELKFHYPDVVVRGDIRGTGKTPGVQEPN